MKMLVGHRRIACTAIVLIALGVWAYSEHHPAHGVEHGGALPGNAPREEDAAGLGTHPDGEAGKPKVSAPATAEGKEGLAGGERIELGPEAKRICLALDIDCDKDITSVERMHVPNQCFIQVATTKHQALKFDDAGILREYWLMDELKIPEGLTLKDGITLAEATKRANAILAKTGIEMVFSESDGQYFNPDGNDNELDAYSRWEFGRQQEYGGFPYLFNSVKVNVRAYNGEIDCLFNRMTKYHPENLDERVSASDAVRTAEEFFWKQCPKLAGTSANYVREWIVYPNDRLGSDTPPAKTDSSLECPKPRLCWGVSFGLNKGALFVDSATGKIIGGL